MDETSSTKSNTNVIYARHCFYKRCQDWNETLHEFLEQIRCLAKSCEFRGEEDYMIRDRIVFGIDDDDLREKFIADGGNPSLEHVIQACVVFGLTEERNERRNDTTGGMFVYVS